jgi:hypothetical protein
MLLLFIIIIQKSRTILFISYYILQKKQCGQEATSWPRQLRAFMVWRSSFPPEMTPFRPMGFEEVRWSPGIQGMQGGIWDQK